MKPQALLFDAYGTLFDVHSVVQRCNGFWPGKGAQLSQLWRTKQLEYTWQRSLMRRYVPFSTVTREALAYACEALALQLTVVQMEALMSEYLALGCYPDVAGVLERLRGVRLGVFSNGSPDMLDPLVKHSGLAFEAVLSVDEVKVFKPAPETYERAALRMRLPKESIAFVSSNGWDALGAKSFGFAVYWINRQGAPLDRLGFRPDAVLKSLGELPAILL
jgi:2-haloacid dehalogenase